MLRFEFGDCLLPKKDKADRGGEDALFSSVELGALGFADGVATGTSAAWIRESIPGG